MAMTTHNNKKPRFRRKWYRNVSRRTADQVDGGRWKADYERLASIGKREFEKNPLQCCEGDNTPCLFHEMGPQQQPASKPGPESGSSDQHDEPEDEQRDRPSRVVVDRFSFLGAFHRYLKSDEEPQNKERKTQGQHRTSKSRVKSSR